MSSHHIIREDQEPALVIDTTDPENMELIQQLLEWSPTVAVTQRALEKVLLWGTKFDLVVSQEANIETLKVQLTDHLPIKILSCNSPAEAVATALFFFTAYQQKNVNIVSDMHLQEFETFTSLNLAVIQNGKRWVFIRNGHFEKWLPAGTHLTVYPQHVHPSLITEKDGMFTLHREPGFWICEIN